MSESPDNPTAMWIRSLFPNQPEKGTTLETSNPAEQASRESISADEIERMQTYAAAAKGHPTWSVAYCLDVPKLLAEIDWLASEVQRLKVSRHQAVEDWNKELKQAEHWETVADELFLAVGNRDWTKEALTAYRAAKNERQP